MCSSLIVVAHNITVAAVCQCMEVCLFGGVCVQGVFEVALVYLLEPADLLVKLSLVSSSLCHHHYLFKCLQLIFAGLDFYNTAAAVWNCLYFYHVYTLHSYSHEILYNYILCLYVEHAANISLCYFISNNVSSYLII